MLKFLLLLLFFIFSTPVVALLNINHTAIAGGVAVLDYYAENPNIKAFYGKARLYVQTVTQKPPFHQKIFVGIPLLSKAGTQQIRIIDKSSKTLKFAVKPHRYPTQHIRLSADKNKYISPNAAEIKRIRKESAILQKAKRHFSAAHYARDLFIAPASGLISGQFGSQRFYNNKPRRPHSGIDYAVAMNTPIIAPASGYVILVGDFFFNGKTIFFDHGNGLISAFIHLNKILVKKGQFIKRGEILALSGRSGRTTGAHLHWGLYLNQIAVQPKIFLSHLP